jgi:hypothetical protein
LDLRKPKDKGGMMGLRSFSMEDLIRKVKGMEMVWVYWRRVELALIPILT